MRVKSWFFVIMFKQMIVLLFVELVHTKKKTPKASVARRV